MHQLVPHGPSPVVVHDQLAPGLHLLGGVVEEKVNQDGVNAGVWVGPENLASDEFDAPDAAGCVGVHLCQL